MVLAPDTFRRLCRARAILCDLDGDTPAVGELAAQLGMSPFRLIRAFDAVFGLTPHQLRIRVRVERAKHLLAADRAVTDVCMEVGFSSLGSFSSLFARRTGETPSGYRQRARTMVQVPGTLPPALVPGCLDLMRQLPPFALRNSREA
jgi:AraC-like DNA-binding protein